MCGKCANHMRLPMKLRSLAGIAAQGGALVKGFWWAIQGQTLESLDLAGDFLVDRF